MSHTPLGSEEQTRREQNNRARGGEQVRTEVNKRKRSKVKRKFSQQAVTQKQGARG